MTSEVAGPMKATHRHIPPVEQWGISASLRPLEGGHRNRVFRTVGLSQDLVFKSSRRSGEALEWLFGVHEVARSSGFVVPQFIRSRRGLLIEDGWTCEEFISGTAFRPDEKSTIVPLITRFHRLASGMPQRPGFLSTRDLLTQDSGGDVDLRMMPADLVAKCRLAWSLLESDSHTIVHGDLNTANLLRTPGGRPVLLDWDECRVDSAVFDLAGLVELGLAEHLATRAWEVACSWQLEPDYARNVARGL